MSLLKDQTIKRLRKENKELHNAFSAFSGMTLKEWKALKNRPRKTPEEEEIAASARFEPVKDIPHGN